MKAKNIKHSQLRRNLIILSLFFLFALYIAVKSNFQPIRRPYSSFLSICNKIPPSLSETLVRYATTNATLLQTFEEISVTSSILKEKSPCNFLVFGVGHDSPLWATLNQGGRTLFLEESKYWTLELNKEIPWLEIHHVMYKTKVSEAKKLFDIGKSKQCQTVGDPRLSKCPLVLKELPSEVYETEWDLIMVDAPTAFTKNLPGRMTAIYTAGILAKNRRDGETDVFVHDIDRDVEDKFSRSFLCQGYTTEQVGRLRHYRIPSHMSGAHTPFCP
ncbi:hypothetical protein ABFS83_03G127500 [Erythranthe nasuta]